MGNNAISKFFAVITGRIIWLVIFLLVLASSSLAQTSSTDGMTPASLTPGAPAGSYALSELDSVNPFNGNLSFHLPLYGINGRGDARMPLTLSIEQRWRVEHYYNHFIAYDQYFPSEVWWTGIQPGYGPGVLQGRTMGFSPQICDPNGPTYTPQHTLFRLTFTTPDGTEFELRDQNTGGQPFSVSACATMGGLRGTTFITSDGTAATFTSDTPIRDDVYSIDSYALYYPSGYLMLRDGKRYRIDNGLVTWMRDRNGNRLSFIYDSNKRVTSITDSLNRQVTITYDVNDVAPYGLCDQIRFQGVGGVPRIIRVSKTSLGNVLRSGFTLQTYYQLFPELNSSCNYCTVNPTVVSAVWLPNNRPYKFYYNSYIELARVELPTGGAFEYDHAAGMSNGPASGAWISDSYVELYRRMVEKRTYLNSNSSTINNVTTYSKPESINPSSPSHHVQTLGYVLEDHLDSSRARLSRTKHYYYGHTYASPVEFVGYTSWKDGKEYQTELIDNNGSTVLRRINYTWRQRASISWWSSWASSRGHSTAVEPANDPRLVETVTTLLGVSPNLQSKQTSINPADPTGQTVGFDQYNNQTDVWEYDYGQGAPPTFPTRHTRTDYLSNNVVNGLTYNYQTNTLIHLRSLPSRSRTYAVNPSSGAETLFSDMTLTYDQSTLTDNPGVSGMDAAFTSSYLLRGNVTRASRWLDTSNTWLNADIQYDAAGNAIRATDSRGKVTQMEYSISSQYAYPTRTISPIPDTGNNFCSTTALETVATYDFSTGLMTSTTDANNQMTSYTYNDVLDRPTTVTRPAGGGSTTYSYDDTPGSIYIGTLTTRSASVTFESYQRFDGFGRPYRSFQSEYSDPANPWLTSDTQYDALGRVWRVSDTYRSSGFASPINPSGIWTTTAFDALGRATSVTTSDNAVAVTAYSGNQVTVTDQAGKKRSSVTDALGRLTRVIEDPGGSLAAQTDYTYDALGNLRKVSQGTQSRHFMYDSLSRVTRVRNPEQNVNVNLTGTDPVTGNAQWSISYAYDNNGNLIAKTDARNVTATYSYDNINRNTEVSYSDGTLLHHIYDSATNGRGRSRGVFYYVGSGANSQTTINNYDAMGRPLDQLQYFLANGVWGTAYTVSRTYDWAGHVTSQTYPSGRTVSNTYDRLGRTTSFTGNLGDSVSRTYMTALVFDTAGRMTREQFGTDIPLYNKRLYNQRGQLYDMRLSSVNNNIDWDRGAIVNYYSLANYGFGTSGTDNNGNLYIQQHWIPGGAHMQQNYAYDSLNRISSVGEYQNGVTLTGVQNYNYDRWGNRTIATSSSGTGINTKQFTVDSATNRLGVPAGQSGAMSYDANGNLLNDTYTSYGSRTYDVENRMLTAWDSNGQQSIYTYDGDGRRVRRKVGTQAEVWQVYGIDGELVAEYAANSAPTAPQKEYGYRNGELLIVATAASNTARPNFALASQGAVATASSSTPASDGAGNYEPVSAINGEHLGVGTTASYSNNSFWRDGTDSAYPDWLQVDFNGTKTINEIDVYTLQDNYTNPVEPSESTTFSLYGITSFDVQYWNGSSWATVPGGSVTGNNKVWRKFSFTPLTTTKIRIVVNNALYNRSRIVEVKAYGITDPSNVALVTNGAVATASSSTPASDGAGNYEPVSAINGEHLGVGTTASYSNNSFWRDGTDSAYPDWLQVDFNGTKTINEIDVYTLQDNYTNPVEPSESTTFSLYGITSFDVQYWNGSSWATVPGGSVTGNNKVWRKFSFTPLTTTKIRIVVNNALYNRSRIVEVKAHQSGETGSGQSGATGIEWLVSDQLGTPRMIADKTGSLAGIRRHDYLPFGEEMVAGSGGRTTLQGYSGTDGARQKFAAYERDNETGLDYAQARYYGNRMGRFTTPDPLMASAYINNPQSWNRYSYVLNRPVNLIDPSGLSARPTGGMCPAEYRSCTENEGDIGSEEAARGLADFDNRLRHQQNAMAATRAAQAGDLETYNELMASDPTLAVEDCGCTLTVRGRPGQTLSPDNPLKFPGRGGGSRSLGPAALPLVWGYRIEESGTVPGYIMSWEITRTWVDKTWGVYEDGSTFGGRIDDGFEFAEDISKDPSSNTFYTIDAPGIPRLSDLPKNATLYYLGNFTTRLSRDKLFRVAEWSVFIKVTPDGKVTGQFRNRHVRMRPGPGL